MATPLNVVTWWVHRPVWARSRKKKKKQMKKWPGSTVIKKEKGKREKRGRNNAYKKKVREREQGLAGGRKCENEETTFIFQ